MTEYSILVPPPRRHRMLWIALALVIVLAAVGGGAYLVGKKAQATGNGGGRTAAAPTTTSTLASTLRVVATTPATGATNVPSDQTVSIQLTTPVSPSSAMPTLSPPVAGSWKAAGDTLTFQATAPFLPTTVETLTIPAGPTGLTSVHGARLATPTTATFTVGQASTERLQQMLAQLGYLPLTFTPSAPLASPAGAFTAQAGSFAWKWPGLPTELTSLWTEGTENVITKGALMSFQNQSGLTVDAVAGTQVWNTLLADTAAQKTDPNPYVWVFVSKALPEALTLFSNGVADPQLTNVAVNTGVPGADTADGTYPVFEHVPSSRMRGTNPDGTTYDDPAVPWASFFNGGDALHGFVRPSYGSPQSNGCVEMPVATAAVVYPLTPIGTLVTVTGPAS